MSETILPEGWPRPPGYANAMSARGWFITVAGQVGWNPLTGRFETDDFAAQVAQALRNVVEILAAAGGRPEHVVRLTWYVTNREEYVSRLAAVGAAYRETFGGHYPAMTLIVVAGLLEPRAKVEIEATAVIPN